MVPVSGDAAEFCAKTSRTAPSWQQKFRELTDAKSVTKDSNIAELVGGITDKS